MQMQKLHTNNERKKLSINTEIYHVNGLEDLTSLILSKLIKIEHNPNQHSNGCFLYKSTSLF